MSTLKIFFFLVISLLVSQAMAMDNYEDAVFEFEGKPNFSKLKNPFDLAPNGQYVIEDDPFSPLSPRKEEQPLNYYWIAPQGGLQEK